MVINIRNLRAYNNLFVKNKYGVRTSCLFTIFCTSNLIHVG